MSLGTAASAAAVRPALDILEQLSKDYPYRDFAIRFWDGTVVGPKNGHDPLFTLVLHHPGSVRTMLWPFNKAALGEAYIFGDIDIEGDIGAFLDLLMHWQSVPLTIVQKLGIFRKLLALPNERRPRVRRHAQLNGIRHSEERDGQAVRYHYDTPPREFFELFLDSQLQYSCGYFQRSDDDIDTAQQAKLEHICRKLRLKPGERLLDIGCGWGSLIIHAARNYGVKAVGCTISDNQYQAAMQKIESAGLHDCCQVLFCDYRQIPEEASFDKVVSVGFIEHVGEENFPVLYAKIWRLLRPQGLYLNHGITFKPHTPYPRWREFALRYVFPDGELVPVDRTIAHLCKAGFEIRDVESLREHYGYTLDRWLHRLEANRDDAVRLADEVTYRIYRLYFAGARRGFFTGLYNLYQTLVVKPIEDATELPLTRADLYQ